MYQPGMGPAHGKDYKVCHIHHHLQDVAGLVRVARPSPSLAQTEDQVGESLAVYGSGTAPG